MHNVYQIVSWNGDRFHAYNIASCENSADAIAIARAMSERYPSMVFEAHVNTGDPGVKFYSFKDGKRETFE